MKEALQRNDLDRSERNEFDDLDLELELSSDAEAQGANGNAMASVKLSTKKKEALSQVPCKFFRSNGCSAGSSCPFAHIGPGEGQGKAVCQWFLKGSCRFGHKCALAHILPGQPMSMDRKNKRAAHHQQQGQNPTSNSQGLHINQQRSTQDPRQQMSQPTLQQISSSRGFDMPNDMLIGRSGVEDPTRNFMSAFTNQQNREGDLLFGVPDDLQAINVNHSATSPSQQSIIGNYRSDWRSQLAKERGEDFDSNTRHESSLEGIHRTQISTQAFGTSPFSHPGSQSVFYSNNSTANREGEGSNFIGQASISARDPWREVNADGERESYNTGGNDINEEDFLPSSLSDLLTPAELQRRSRVGLIAGQNFSQVLTPHSLPARTAISPSPWDASYQQRRLHPQSSLSRDGEESFLTNASDKLARGNPVAVTSPLPPPLYLQPGHHSQLGVSNTSAGFLTSRLRRGLSSGNMDDEIDGTNSGPLDAYSPGAYAALSHAPGQSLPQGLASGLSSLHLRSDIGRGGESGRAAGRLQGDNRFVSTTSYQNQNGIMIGSYSRGIDDLGPTAPSSIFAHKMPLHFGVARSTGLGSASTSFDALHHQGSNHATPLSTSMNGSAHIFSPYARSPAQRTEGGIAIPSNTGEISDSTSSLHSNINNHNNHIFSNNNKSSLTSSSHLSKHRVRNAGNVAGSPLSLPTTGEEVEEPIFELE